MPLQPVPSSPRTERTSQCQLRNTYHMWTRSQGAYQTLILPKLLQMLGQLRTLPCCTLEKKSATASTVDTGIAQQLVAPYTLPIPVPSIHATLGAHVSQSHKNRIINGEYIDLALLLENTTISEKQENKL